MERVRAKRRIVAASAEKAKEAAEADLHDAEYGKLLDRYNRVPGSGTYPTVDEVLMLRKDNKLSPQMTNSLVSMIRSDREMNGAGTAVLSRGGGSSSKDDDGISGLPGAAVDLLNQVYARKMTPEHASRLALQRAEEGQFGSGPARYKALADFRKNLNLAQGLQKEAMDGINSTIGGWVRPR